MMRTASSNSFPQTAAALVLGLSAVWGWPLESNAQSQQGEAENRVAPTVSHTPAHPFIKNATWILDQPVQNDTGKTLGAVTDFAINTSNGRIEFLALGPGVEMKLLPPQALAPLTDEAQLTLSISDDLWETAPTVRREELSELSMAGGSQEVYRFYNLSYPPPHPREQPAYGSVPRPDNARLHNPLEYGSPPDRERGPSFRDPRVRRTARAGDAAPDSPAPSSSREFGAPPSTRSSIPPSAPHLLHWASQLIGSSVSDRNGKSVGEVSDFILNLRSGRVQHLILSYSGEHFAVPMRVARIGEKGRVTIRPTAEALQRAPRYDPRQASMRPLQPFLFTQTPEPEFRAPARSAGTLTSVGSDRAPEVRREARDRSAQTLE